MNAIDHSSYEPHGEHGASDVTPRANLVIWGYFFALGLGLYFSITGLTFYFRYQVEREQFAKVGSVQSPELIELRQQEQQVLGGGQVDGKKTIAIDDAMNLVIESNQKARGQ